jgi:hypothetical protein
MANGKQQAETKYTVQAEFSSREYPTGTDVRVPYEYRVLSDDEVTTLNEVGRSMDLPKLASMTQQTLKEDAGNNARVKARQENGHIKVVLMSEEAKQKAARTRRAIADFKAGTIDMDALASVLKDN